MLAALELEAVRTEGEFYDLTEGELAFRCAAARRRILSREVLGLRIAWHAAAWGSFSRELIPWDEVYGMLTGEGPRVSSPEEVENLVTFMAKVFGGTIEKTPPVDPPPAKEAARV